MTSILPCVQMVPFPHRARLKGYGDSSAVLHFPQSLEQYISHRLMFLITADYRDDQSVKFVVLHPATKANLPHTVKWKGTKLDS